MWLFMWRKMYFDGFSIDAVTSHCIQALNLHTQTSKLCVTCSKFIAAFNGNSV